MNHPFRASMTLATLAFAALCGQAARAQLTYSNQTSTYTIDPSDSMFSTATVTYEAAYQVDGPAGMYQSMVSIFGDTNTVTWTGNGGQTINSIIVDPIGGTATANVTTDGTTGYGAYSYVSGQGDGILSSGVIGATYYALFDSFLPESTDLTTPSEIDIILPGDWSTFGNDQHDIVTGSFSINPDYTVTNFFGYDAMSNDTVFQAIATPGVTSGPNVSFILQGVPEPGNIAMLVGLAITGLGVVARRKK